MGRDHSAAPGLRVRMGACVAPGGLTWLTPLFVGGGIIVGLGGEGMWPPRSGGLLPLCVGGSGSRSEVEPSVPSEERCGDGVLEGTGGSMSTSGRGGSSGGVGSGTGGRSANKTCSIIPIIVFASHSREARMETLRRVRLSSACRAEFDTDADESALRASRHSGGGS